MNLPDNKHFRKEFERIIERNPFLSTSNAVYETLLKLIISGEIPGGSVIRQGELAEQLGLSRTPVRDALSRLNQEGFLEKNDQGNARVYSLDARDYSELVQFRMELEVLAAKMTAFNYTAETSETLKRAQSDLFAATEKNSRQAALNADERFHLAIIDACNNQYVIATYHHYLRKIRYYRYLLSVKQNWKSTLQAHERIMEAIADRDLEACEKQMRHHLMISKRVAESF